MEMDALAEANRQQAMAADNNDNEEEDSGVSQDLLDMSLWFRRNRNRNQSSTSTNNTNGMANRAQQEADKQTARRKQQAQVPLSSQDPNLGQESDGPIVRVYTGNKVALDGKTLKGEGSATEAMFRTRYGDQAEEMWVTEHNEEVRQKRQIIGTSQTPSWMRTKAPTKSGTSNATPQSQPSTLMSKTPKDVITVYDTGDGKTKIILRETYDEQIRAHPQLATQLQIVREDSPGTTLPTVTYAGNRTTYGQPTVAPYQPGTVSNGAPTTLGAVPTNASISAPPSADDPIVTIQNKSNFSIIRIRKSVWDNDPAYSQQYDIIEDVPNAPLIEKPTRSTTTQRQSNTVPYNSETGEVGTSGTFKPQRMIVRYDPVTGTTYEEIAPEDQGLVTDTQAADKPKTAPDTQGPIDIDSNPVDMLAVAAVNKRGGSVTDIQNERLHIIQGIGQLIRGEREGVWAEAYLNDIARVAWAREMRSQGQIADPRSTPLEYIEKWKDAFYGSDATVPLVKELDQAMIDAAVSRTTTGQTVFNWKDAYGESGENGLISRQVASNDCGPNAFSVMLRSRGYNIDPGTAYNYSRKYGYHDGDQFTGPANFARMLRQEAGLDAEAKPMDWNTVDAELDAGRPVALSSQTHYWTTSAYRDTERGREYYVGATGAVAGNPVWATRNEISFLGAAPNTIITAKGIVDPRSRSVQELGLRPPGPQAPSRANLTRTTTRPSNSGSSNTNLSYTEDDSDSGVLQYAPLIQTAAQENNTDPYWIAAIMQQESGGKANARSRAGAGGVMQIMPDTARNLGVQDVDDPEQNVRGGAKYFKQLLDMFDGDVDSALAAYNAGPGAVMKYGGIPPYEETRDFVRRVKANYQRLAGNQVFGRQPAGVR